MQQDARHTIVALHLFELASQHGPCSYMKSPFQLDSDGFATRREDILHRHL